MSLKLNFNRVKYVLVYGLALVMLLGGHRVAAAAEQLPAEPGTFDGSSIAEFSGAELEGGLKACGSDGFLYSDVAYLSAATVAGFDRATQENYIALCDEIAGWKNAGEDVRDIVLYVDRQGVLGLSYTLPNQLYGAEVIEVQGSESRERGVTILGDVPGEGLFRAPEEENLALMERNAGTEETFEELEALSFDTLYDKDSYFKGQLTSSLEKQMYDLAKSRMVKGKSNSISMSVSAKPGNAVIANVFSAIQNAYPSSFEWADRSGGIKIVYGGGSLKVTMDKSKHYSASLLNSAQKKAQTLVDEAYQYAAESYPDAPAYGLIQYFDQWICENNYYNNIGLGQTQADLASKEFYYCHSSIGILTKGYGVCESYALAVNRLLDIAGIPSMVVYGTGNGGGHAWNYVKMPNGNWYMLDTTWNDGGNKSNGQYRLSAADTKHVAMGSRFVVGQKFDYPALAGSNYSGGAEAISLNQSELVLTKGKKQQLSMSNDYYSNFRHTWSGSNPKVAKVDAKGKITAVAPGKAVATCTVAGKKMSCTIYVYQWTGLTFANNKKSSLSYNYSNKDLVLDSSDELMISIMVGQKERQMSAANIQTKAGLAAPKATVSNSRIAAVNSCTLSGNVITLKIQVLKMGSTKINVSFGGKKAALSLKVTQALQANWFEALSETSVEYTGKAFKPKVKASAALPNGVKYKVTYANNKNAGTATVSITGTGNYSGTVKKTFQITPRDFQQGEFVSCGASKTYIGKANPAATVVKWKGKRLKAGTDYIVSYSLADGSRTTAPTAAGSYTVTVTGTGNYKGSIDKSFTYTITKAPVTSLKVTCPSTIKYKAGEDVTPAVKVKIKNTVLGSGDYTLGFYDADGKPVSRLTEKGKYTLQITPKGNVEATKKKSVITKKITVK